MEITFQKIELKDRAVIDHYLRQQDCRSCELTFANIYLWNRFYPVEYAVVEDALILRGEGEERYYNFPLGRREQVKPALDAVMDYCRKRGEEFEIGLITPDQFALLEQDYPGEFTAEYDRDAADYVYEVEKLIALSGKKYHGKKNHINKFEKLYPDWKYETITDGNVEECFQMALAWRSLNGCDEEEEKSAEMCVALNALRLMKELSLTGGLLRVGGDVAAFCIGERLTEDTIVVHIEKAFSAIEGAYTMINREFLLHEAAGYTYVNREDDVGDAGLRQAKLSYHPAFLVEKGFARKKEEQ